jgi:hypothetical protein
MSNLTNTNATTSFNNVVGARALTRITNQVFPPAGNQTKGLLYQPDLSVLTSPYSLDLSNAIASGLIDQIQSAWLDNSNGTAPLTLLNVTTNASVTVKPRCQLWTPLLAGYTPESFLLTGNALVTIVFINVPMPVAQIETGLPATWQSYSVIPAVSVSTQLMPQDPTRKNVMIANNGTVTCWLNFLGGTAAANAADCVPLLAGQVYENQNGEPCWQQITYYTADTSGNFLTALGAS